MKADIKEAWIAALESGDYEQGTDSLRTRDDKYCCLGVLCDLAAKAGIVKWDRRLRGDDPYTLWKCVPTEPNRMGSSGTLPGAVSEWAGIDGDNPNIGEFIIHHYDDDPDGEGDYDEKVNTLAEVNDGGQSFATIVELIREKL